MTPEVEQRRAEFFSRCLAAYGLHPGMEREAVDRLNADYLELRKFTAERQVVICGLLGDGMRLVCTGQFGTSKEHLEAELAGMVGEQAAAVFCGMEN